jgi:hypothetical protein
MTYPKILAGQTVTAALLNAGQRQMVTNSGGSQATTLTTFVDITSLGFAVEANARYFARTLVAYDAPVDSANGDVNFQWTGPGDATLTRRITGLELAATTNIDANLMSVARDMGTDVRVGGTGSTANAFTIYEEVIDLRVVTAGTVQLQFALGAGVATATIQADSVIYYQRVA